MSQVDIEHRPDGQSSGSGDLGILVRVRNIIRQVTYTKFIQEISRNLVVRSLAFLISARE